MLTSIRGLVAATLMAGCGLAATPAFADEADPPAEITITGNVALVTDYRFRGLSQTSGDPAIQGAININHKSGFYVGVWSSSLDFSDTFPALDPIYGGQEVDVYGGWTGAIGGVTADVGLLYYVYPGGHVGKANFFEPYASISATMGPVTGKVGVAYAPAQASLDFNADGDSDDNTYVYLDLSAGIPDTGLSVSGHVGYTSGALSPKFATGQTPNYAGGWDYNIGASYNITKNLSIGVQYIGVDGTSIDRYSNDTVVGTLKFAF
jgi:uncharacterized protein (TIGR02001 family)